MWFWKNSAALFTSKLHDRDSTHCDLHQDPQIHGFVLYDAVEWQWVKGPLAVENNWKQAGPIQTFTCSDLEFQDPPWKGSYGAEITLEHYPNVLYLCFLHVSFTQLPF